MGIFGKKKNAASKSPKQRRAENNEFIKSQGIDCYEELPITRAADEVRVRDVDTICRRAAACLLVIQIACDIAEGNDPEESREAITKFLERFGVTGDLLPKERRVLDGTCSDQDVIDVGWSYEAYWSLVWALGLIGDDEMKIPDGVCDCMKAIRLVADRKGLDDFKGMAKMRGTDEILDMLDLYYRYDWACVDKRINPGRNIGGLVPEVVTERRRGLEWLISDEADWNDISMDT